MDANQFRVCWTTKDVISKGVRRVRVSPATGRSAWSPWKNCDKWEHFSDSQLFENREDAVLKGEQLRQKRRDMLQSQIDRLAKPMRVVEKIKVKAWVQA